MVVIICYLFHSALPDVASPEQQSGGGSGSLGAGVIVGIAVGTLVIITLLLGVGVFCAMKIRLRSRSKSVAVAFDSIGFGKNRRSHLTSKPTQCFVLMSRKSSLWSS